LSSWWKSTSPSRSAAAVEFFMSMIRKTRCST
jgi:hypothetical protein